MEPKVCPFGCGPTLVVKKVTCQAYLDTLPNDADLNQVHGFLCKSCGYATTMYAVIKKG